MMLEDVHDGLRVVQMGREGILDDMARDALSTTIVMRGALSRGAEWMTTGASWILDVGDGRITIDRGRGVSITLQGPGHPKRRFGIDRTAPLGETIDDDPTSFATRFMVMLMKLSCAPDTPLHVVHPAAIAIISEASDAMPDERIIDDDPVSLVHPGPIAEAGVRLKAGSGKKGPVIGRPGSLSLLKPGVAVKERGPQEAHYTLMPIVDVVPGRSIDALSRLRSSAALDELRKHRP